MDPSTVSSAATAREPAWTPDTAYEQSHAEMAALRDTDLLVVNLDVPSLVGNILRGLPALKQVDARLRARWRETPPAQVARLERYAWALQHTHRLYRELEVTRPDPALLVEELRTLQRSIFNALQVLAQNGWVDASLLEPYRNPKSHRSLVTSVCGLVALCRAHWTQIENRTPLSSTELNQAFARAMALAQVLPRRRQPLPPLVHALRERRQAFTLVLREYTAFRRAALFLCTTKAEADQLVPSLYRKKRRPAPGDRAAPAVAIL